MEMENKKPIYLPTVKNKPLVLICFEPGDTIDRKIIDDYIATAIQQVFNATAVSKQVFDRESHFRLDERLIYVPNIAHTRQFLKCKIDAGWAREKSEAEINPTYFISDVLLYENKFYIKLTLNGAIVHAAPLLAEFISTQLSHHGKCFIMVHKRQPGTERGCDFELFKEVIMGRFSNVYMKYMGSQPSVFDRVYEEYSISIQKVVTEMDFGIELQCAPYDLQEYYQRMRMYEEAADEKIAEIQLDDPTETSETSSETPPTNTVGAENSNEIIEIKALIKATEELLLNKSCNVDTFYYKMSLTRFNEIMTKGRN